MNWGGHLYSVCTIPLWSLPAPTNSYPSHMQNTYIPSQQFQTFSFISTSSLKSQLPGIISIPYTSNTLWDIRYDSSPGRIPLQLWTSETRQVVSFQNSRVVHSPSKQEKLERRNKPSHGRFLPDPKAQEWSSWTWYPALQSPPSLTWAYNLLASQVQCGNCSVRMHRASSMLPVRTDVGLILIVLFNPPLSILLECSESGRSVSIC